MTPFRSRASLFASFALAWQLAALIVVPAAACHKSAAAGAVEMPNCPMRHDPAKALQCPMHAPGAVEHDCHCPQLGCAQTSQGFLALLGPIAVLPTEPSAFSLHKAGDAAVIAAASEISLAPAPIAPPPRA